MSNTLLEKMVDEAKMLLATYRTRMDLNTAARVNCQIVHLEPAEVPKTLPKEKQSSSKSATLTI